MLIKCFGPSTRCPMFSTHIPQLFIIKICWGYVASVRILGMYESPVQFSSLWSQGYRSQVKRSKFHVLRFYDPGSQGLVSQNPRFQGLRSQGPGFQDPRSQFLTMPSFNLSNVLLNIESTIIKLLNTVPSTRLKNKNPYYRTVNLLVFCLQVR